MLALNNLISICIENKINHQILANLAEDKDIYQISVKPDVKAPTLLVLSGANKGESTGLYGISRFLNNYPLDQFPEVGVDFLPLMNVINKKGQSAYDTFGLKAKSIEAKMINRELDKRKYNLCLSILDSETQHTFSLSYSSLKLSELTFKILDTASLYFPISDSGDGVGRFFVPKNPQDTNILKVEYIEDLLVNKIGSEIIKLTFPLSYSSTERVGCCARIIEDTVQHLSPSGLNVV